MTLSTLAPGASRVGVAEPDDTRELVRAVGDLLSLVEPRLLALWRATGVTFGQRRVLRQLRDGPRAAGAVAASLGVAAPTLTRHLLALEQRGLVARSTDPADRRRVMVALTSSGRRSLANNRVFSGGPIVAAARELDAEQRHELLTSLRSFADLARKHRDRGEPVV